MMRTATIFVLVLSVAHSLATSTRSAASPVVSPIEDWGENPTGLELHGYIPKDLPKNPGVILALHACSLNGTQYSEETRYITYADKRGFITLFPSTKNDYKCWDVASEKSLTRNGGGDSTGLINIVKWAMSKYDADPAKIFVTGSSSGCMMTNVMVATYPDVFSASSCYSGFPAGCLKGSPGSSPETADDRCVRNMKKTGTEWARLARDMYPGYEGSYPRMLVWHGTADELVSYEYLSETLKQWSTVMGLQFTRNDTATPELNYTQMVYGNGERLLGYSAEGVGHTVPVHDELDLDWFGLPELSDVDV